MQWSSAFSPPAPVVGCTEAQWGKKRLCDLLPMFQGYTGRCDILGHVKGHLGECGDEVGVWTGTKSIRQGRKEKRKRDRESQEIRQWHISAGGEKKERMRWRKAPLFPPGGGNSEPGCHVDNCLHLHLSSPW